MRRRQRGFTLVEMLVTLAVFGIFIAVIGILTYNMFYVQQKWPINYMTHPESAGMIARVRRDVLDSMYYPAEFEGWMQSNKTLIVYVIGADGYGRTIIYDFRKPGEPRRLEYKVKDLMGTWIGRAMPTFEIQPFTLETGQDAVRLIGRDSNGKLSIDQIFVPRTHT